MLVLGRKRSESIKIFVGGETIEVVVADIVSNNYTRIGIVAPKNFTIIRSELEEKNKDSD